MPSQQRQVVLVQLPIPPVSAEPVVGNVPLAAGYLAMMVRLRGLEAQYRIDIFPTALANTLGDTGLAEELASRRPWLVGFTCYLWNIDRVLHVARQLKRRRPEVLIVLGGPEITADNAWVLADEAVDFAAIGEGEQTFVELLAALVQHRRPSQPIAGLYDRQSACNAAATPGTQGWAPPAFRRPLPRLDDISSPYLAGILDAADEQMLLLETVRGCIFKCKFCYYPKSYDDLYFVSRDKIAANLDHAAQRGAREVVLLDPTLNQRKDFTDLLRLLAQHNRQRQFTYFGELRAEGLNDELAALLREANFTEVEIGLQSIDPLAMQLMDRRNNLRAFERGIRALMNVGIAVKVDLIIGLPGDTVDSVRRGVAWLRDSGLYTSMQVFNLAILPGTAFRQEAAELGLKFSPRTPYYVVSTPTLDTADLYGLMEEAQEMLGVEFDPLPAVDISAAASFCRAGSASGWLVDLDSPLSPPPANRRTQAFTLWLRADDFNVRREAAANHIRALLRDNPHTTLQIVLEPGRAASMTPELLADLTQACYEQTSYLDRFYSILPGPRRGAKRLVVLLDEQQHDELPPAVVQQLSGLATLVCRASAAAG